MKFRTIGALPEGYVAPNPIDPASPLPSAAPLPPGATVSVGVENTGGWSLEKFGSFVGVGADLAKKVGVDLGPVAGFDFPAAFSKIAAFAGVGVAVGGPVGAVVAAVVGVILTLSGTWGRLQNPNWYGVGPGVHAWATLYAPNAFIAKAQADGTNNWPTVTALVKQLLAWWMAEQGVVLTGQNNRHYNNTLDSVYLYELQIEDPEGPKKFYANAGVDWYATREQRFATGNFNAASNVMMYAIEVKTAGSGSDLDPANDIPDGSGGVFGDGETSGAAVVLGGLAIGVLLLSGKKR